MKGNVMPKNFKLASMRRKDFERSVMDGPKHNLIPNKMNRFLGLSLEFMIKGKEMESTCSTLRDS
jgi:hypothetical protein